MDNMKGLLAAGFTALLVFIIGALFIIQSNHKEIEASHKETISKLRADVVSLKTELANRDNLLKSERSKVDLLTRELAEDSATATEIKKLIKSSQIKYKKDSDAKNSAQVKKVAVSRGVKRGNYESAIKAAGAGYWSSQAELDALVWISNHESRTPGVVSKGGHQGLFQLGNPPKWMVLGDASSETKAGCEYIKRRYGSPTKAKAFWQGHGWY